MRNQTFAVMLGAGGYRTSAQNDKVGIRVRVYDAMSFCQAASLVIERLGPVEPATKCIEAYVHIFECILYQSPRWIFGIIQAMKLKLNREFAIRHLFVAVLLTGMGAWFAYDGYVAYPSMTPEALYEQIEHQPPASREAAEKVYANAIPRQKQFMALCIIGAAIVGFGVWRASRFRFTYRERGFSYHGRRYAIADISKVDASQWGKKGILRLLTGDGTRIVLDGWHHKGVDGFYDILRDAGRIPQQ